MIVLLFAWSQKKFSRFSLCPRAKLTDCVGTVTNRAHEDQPGPQQHGNHCGGEHRAALPGDCWSSLGCGLLLGLQRSAHRFPSRRGPLRASRRGEYCGFRAILQPQHPHPTPPPPNMKHSQGTYLGKQDFPCCFEKKKKEKGLMYYVGII